jgi:phosphoribosylformylglycinamidine cyclo-ligase
MLPDDLAPRFDRSSWPVPDVFRWLQEDGNVAEDEMHKTFNMGIGLVFAVAPDQADRAIAELEALGEAPVVIGDVVPA